MLVSRFAMGLVELGIYQLEKEVKFNLKKKKKNTKAQPNLTHIVACVYQTINQVFDDVRWLYAHVFDYEKMLKNKDAISSTNKMLTKKCNDNHY